MAQLEEDIYGFAMITTIQKTVEIRIYSILHIDLSKIFESFLPIERIQNGKIHRYWSQFDKESTLIEINFARCLSNQQIKITYRKK